MTIDDIGEKFCKGCRLSEAEEAGLAETSMMAQKRFEQFNKTEMLAIENGSICNLPETQRKHHWHAETAMTTRSNQLKS